MHKKAAARPEQLFQQLAAFEPLIFCQRKTWFDGGGLLQVNKMK